MFRAGSGCWSAAARWSSWQWPSRLPCSIPARRRTSSSPGRMAGCFSFRRRWPGSASTW